MPGGSPSEKSWYQIGRALKAIKKNDFLCVDCLLSFEWHSFGDEDHLSQVKGL